MVCYGIFWSGQLGLSEAILKWWLLGSIQQRLGNRSKQKDTMEIKHKNKDRKVRYHCFVIVIIIILFILS